MVEPRTAPGSTARTATVESDGLCVICRRRRPQRGRVCEHDSLTISIHLHKLLRQIPQLDTTLVPAVQPTPGERVTTSTVDAQLPVRLAALTLAGPGSEDTEWMPARQVMHPQIWHTRSVHTVRVTRRTIGGAAVSETRNVVLWQRGRTHDAAGYPVWVDNGDQTGVVPPAEWLDMWARRWRHALGHPAPRRIVHRRPSPERRRAQLNPALLAATTHGQRILAWILTVRHEWQQHRARTVLGLANGTSSSTTDPVADELAIRFGQRPVPPAVAADVRYLVGWLDNACAHPDIDIAAMAAGLRSLVAELDRVLGHTPDLQWVGRCPAVLTDRTTGTERVCGAGLWQNPYTGRYADGRYTGEAQLRCPRCHSTWGPNRLDLVALARDIRRTWPLDRRRRYSRAEVEATTAACTGCMAPLHVGWREITAPADDARSWRPETVTCPNGCVDVGKTP